MISVPEIAVALGGRRSGQNTYVCRCPAHADHSPSLALRDASDGRILAKCFAGCGQAAVIDALRARGLWSATREYIPAATTNLTPARSHQDKDARRSAYARSIWSESTDPRGTLAHRYLNVRNLALDDELCGRVFRFHPFCPFGKDWTGKTIHTPALIAAFRPFRDDDETAPPRAIHRIGLKPDGTKLAKLMLGPVTDCAVKLDPDYMVEESLGVCEGIETGIGVRASGWRPVWALGSAGAIAAITPIPGVETITIFVDNDASGVGLAAARACAERWSYAGCESIIHSRAAEGDFADG
ncbi:MAG TPA: toprim domain-containing protein [Nitrobacter sp.]|nr:toprim domain-containing protein [Nitrobacter sp.]